MSSDKNGGSPEGSKKVATNSKSILVRKSSMPSMAAQNNNSPGGASGDNGNTARAVVPAGPSAVAASHRNRAGGGAGGGQMMHSPAQMAQISRQVRQMIDGSTVRPVIPARQYDVISMARAMNREQFAERVQQIFEPERDAALTAIQTGRYVSWRCPDQNHDCQRVGMAGRCFCGHFLNQHKSWDGHAVAVPCRADGCNCRAYSWVPSRPEEVGEYWLRRRPDFDEATYRAKCKCKHTHEQHDPNGDHRCLVKGCARCSHFTSAFLCAACDRHWELHVTFFETAAMRRGEGRAVGEDYIPFSEAPGLKRIVLGGEDRGFDTLDDAINDSYGPHQIQGRNSIQSAYPRLPIEAPPMPKRHGNNDEAFPRPK